MAALAAPVHETGLFKVGNQLSHFARHFSIKIVSHTVFRVNDGASGGTATQGDDDDLELDRKTIKDGNRWFVREPVAQIKMNPNILASYTLKNRPSTHPQNPKIKH